MLFSLSSCALFDIRLDTDGSSSSAGNNGSDGDTVINVEGGDTNNITITSTNEKTALAATKALLSTVSVYCTFQRNSYFNKEEVTAGGAGVIYKLDKNKGDAYIITNHHVVYDSYASTQNGISNNIRVYLYGMENSAYAIPAEYIGGSLAYDIAVLRVKSSTVLMESKAVAATLADSDKVQILDTAIAVGNPELEGISATVGYVNVDSEQIDINVTVGNSSQTINVRVMRTDAAVNGGNSGGGLFNINGEVIGIVNAKNVYTGVESIGYAIPSSLVKKVADNIIHYCASSTLENAYKIILGITTASYEYGVDYDESTGSLKKLEYAVITSVDGSGLVSGTLKKNDVLSALSINGRSYEVTRYYHVSEALLDARVGDVIEISVNRDGETVSLAITVTESMLVKVQ